MIEQSPPAPADRAELYAALAAARAEVKGVGNDSENTFHRYKYTSAEGILEYCTPLLGRHGLSIINVSLTLAPCELITGGEKGPWVMAVGEWVLCHSSGQCQEILREAPFQDEKGRPWDKAIAAANTQMIAYLYRDVLGLPRRDADDDPAGRDDTQYEAPRRESYDSQRGEHTRQPDGPSDAHRARVEAVLTRAREVEPDKGRRTEAIGRAVGSMPNDPDDLTPEQLGNIEAWIRDQPAPKKQDLLPITDRWKELHPQGDNQDEKAHKQQCVDWLRNHKGDDGQYRLDQITTELDRIETEQSATETDDAVTINAMVDDVGEPRERAGNDIVWLAYPLTLRIDDGDGNPLVNQDAVILCRKGDAPDALKVCQSAMGTGELLTIKYRVVRNDWRVIQAEGATLDDIPF